MANHILWFQGSGAGKVTPCLDGPVFTCPESKRIAAEYNQGHYKLSNVMNTGVHPYDFGNTGWLARKLNDVKAGDIVWLALVPPLHVVDDIFMHLHAGQDEGSSLNTLAGAKFTLVASRFSGATDEQTDASNGCTMVGSLVEGGNVTITTQTEAAVYHDLRQDSVFLNLNEWYGVGIRVDTLPTNMDSLALSRAIMGVVTHARGFDMQYQMM